MKRFVPALFLCFLGIAPAQAGDFLDTRVSFTVADDNVAKGPEETVTGSPSIPNFQPDSDNRLFFDNFQRRDQGFENLSHLTLYTHEPGFFAGLDTEAALVLRATVLETGNVVLRDDGSYIRLVGDAGRGDWALTAFPVDADRFQLGYSYDIAWGGSGIFRNAQAAPGIRLRYENPLGYAFLGAKTAVGQVDKADGTKELDTVYGVLAGGGINVLDELRIEGNGGYFYRGTIPKQELRLPVGGQFRTARWEALGASAQVAYNVGMPIGTPIDFRLYRNDPLGRQQQFFRAREYQPGTAVQLSSEVSVLGQTLQDPEKPRSTKIQPAIAADITARMKIDRVRLQALVVFRTLSFILFNVPSNPSFVDFPAGAGTNPETFVAAGIDYFFENLHLTPGFIAGLQMPAYQTGTAQAGNNPPDSLGQQTFVFRTPSDVDILAPGEPVRPIFSSKFTTKWDLSESIAAVGELQASYDANRRRFAQDSEGIIVRQREDPVIIGFALLLQARF